MDNNEERLCLVERNGTATGYGSVFANGKHGNGTYWEKKKNKRTKESGDEEKYQSGLFGLFRYATRTDKLLLSIGLAASVVHGAGFPVLAVVFGQMTNVFIAEAKGEELRKNNSFVRDMFVAGDVIPVNEEFTSYLSHYSIYYLYIGLVVLVAAFIQTACWELSCERQVHRLRQVAFSQILRQDIAWYDTRPQGDLTNLLSDDVERIREGIGCKFSMVTQYVSTFLSGTVVGLAVNWKLTAVLLLVAPVLIGASAYLAKLTAGSAAREQLKYSMAGGVAQEVLTSVRTVAAFSTERNEVQRYDRALEEGRKLAMRKYVVLAWGLTLVFFLMYAQYGLAFYYGAVLIEDGYCSPGSVFTVFFSVLSGAFTLGNALPYVNSVATALGSASSVFTVCDRAPRVDVFSEGGRRPATLRGHVRFRDVHFSYPSRHGAQVLRGLDLDIQPGQTVALVGPSGSGKSTVIQLLLRYYDVDTGVIEVDGLPLRDLSVAWLRGAIGVVSQEPVLFGVSIAENIRYGRPAASQDDVEMAATMANAHGFIDELPQGYETLVGERGAQLSGGQKQRIAIARALVRDPALLLLDEATSALDAESESVVQDALERAMRGRTTVVVAHRLSTVRHADCICVMDMGRIVEQGRHKQLMARGGLYSQLVSTQAAFQADEELTNLGDMTGSSDVDLQVMRHRKGLHTSQTSLYHAQSEDFPDGSARPVSIRSLIKLHRPECGWLVFGILGCVLSGSIMPLFAFFYGEVFATFTLRGKELMEAAMFWSFMFVALGGLAAISIWLEIVMMTVAVEKLVMRLRVMAFRNILRQPVGWFDLDEHSSGRLATRLARDAPLVKGAAGLRLGQLLSSLVTLTAALSVAFVFGWQLALLLLLIVPLIAAGAHQQTRMMRRTQARDNKLMDDAGRLASECVINITTVQALGLETCFTTLYASYLVLPFKEAKRQAVGYSMVFALSQAIIYLMYAAAFRYGAYLIQVEAMTPSEVYRVFFALAFCAASVGTSSAYVQDYNKAKIAASQMFLLIDRKSEIDALSPKGLKPVVRGLVTFDRVSFHYPARPDVRVLRDLTLSVAPGQTLAVVGQSGCGKSTLVALLQRFYQPTGGRVMVDDVDVEEMNVRHLRRHIGLVTQEPTLFHRSIRANIAYGLVGGEDLGRVSDEAAVTARVVEAATIANCHAFITQLPLGYETLVGEGGCQLSGGQKQRIAIARALIRDPRILLLDEATSALDSDSEKLVQEALDKARLGRTCIVIAHRLSTVQNADVIAVLDQGKIREMGSHQELTAQRGLYYQLVKAQQL